MRALMTLVAMQLKEKLNLKGKKIRGKTVLSNVIFGILKLKTEKISYVFRSKKFTIECEEEKYWSFDGEKGQTGKLEFECIPKAIKVISNIK